MAEILRFKAALNPRGAWDASTAYTRLDLVESGGSSYVCLQACTGIQVTNTAYWHLHAAKGAQGDPLTYADLTAAQKAELVQDATAAAQQAAASAQTAAGSAQTASQALTTIQSAIDDLDPSQSADDAVVALAARQGVLEADLSALGPEIDKNEADIAALQEEVVEVGARAGSYDSLPLLGGQPMILFGSGAPVEANVPDNWIGFHDGGFEWIGTPSMMGQQYIDTTNGEKYVSVKNDFTLSWLKV